MKTKFRSISLYLVKIFSFAVIYHLAARLGLKMAYVQANTSPVWPPTGIAIAVLTLFSLSFWPGITLGVLIGSLLTGAPFSLAAGMTFGNTLEAIIAVIVLKKVVHFHDSFDRLNDVIGFALVSLVSTAVGATIGTTSLVLFTQTPQSAFFNIWLTWWIGDLLGALVVAPAIMIWIKPVSFSKYRKTFVEGFGLVILIIFIALYVFSNKPPIDTIHQAMIYVIFPFIIWAALRFGQHGATASIFLISAISIWGTVNGFGPFTQDSINESLILLQTFMGVVALTSLILAATTIERRKSAFALQQRIDDLDTLNNASKSFLGIFDKKHIYQTICRIAVEEFNASGAWIDIPENNEKPNIPVAAYGVTLEAKSKHQVNTKNPGQQIDKEVGSATSTEFSLSNRSIGSFPLNFGNTSFGELLILINDAAAFTEDRNLLFRSYANLAAVAVQNSWLFDEVSRGNVQLHALSQRLMKAQEEERLHLSRELHDESGQILAALMVELGLLNRDNEINGNLKDHFNNISDLSTNLQKNLHRLAANLRPASLDHLGLVKALEQYTFDFSRQHNIAIEFEAVGMENYRLPSDIETSLFRVIQESLTNVALHADASHVDVMLSHNNSLMIAIVEDNGVGFTTTGPAIEKQLGLFGMKERIEMLHGTFTLESSPGKGTTIKVEVPVSD